MPKLLTTPFASEATREYRTDVQNSTGAEPNSATYEQGFPPITMRKINEDGKPPKGSDLNGVLYDITDNLVALTKGARYGFNEAYANAIGGYPLGAVLRLDNGIEVESEVDSNSINPNVDMTGWKLAVSDNGIVTWSGRTQREKNKDFITPLDYKARGDGVTDDTQAFTDLEKDYQGQIIDLLGKTYIVDVSPHLNSYINGSFKALNNVGRNANGDLKYITRPQQPIVNSRTDASEANSNFFLKFRETVFFRNSIQGTAIDEKNRHIYTVQDVDAGCRVIVQHTLDCGEFSTTLRGMNGTTLLSHSGIGIENADNSVYLWAGGAKNNEDSTYANAVKAYRFKPTLFDFNISIYTDIDDGFEKTEYILFDTPASYENMNIAVSYDQKWLIAMNRNIIKGSLVFRFWELSKLVDGGSGDYRNDYTYEIIAKSGNKDGEIDFQGMSACGDCFYVIGGGYYSDQDANPDDPKCQLFVWDLAGNILQHKYDVGIAMQAMTNAAGVEDVGVREVEAINFMKINGGLTPVVTIAGSRNTTEGESTTRQQWLVALGYGSPVKSVTKNLNRSAFISVSDNDSLDYAASRNYRNTSGSVKLGTVNKEGVQYKLLDLSNEGHRSITTTSGDNLTLSYGTGEIKDVVTFITGASTTGVQLKEGISWHFQNPQGVSMWRFNPDGLFRPSVNNTNDFGHSSYRIKKGWFSAINIGNPPVYADNATAKTGGLVAGDLYRTSTGALMVVY